MTTNNHPALVAVNLPASNEPDPLAFDVTRDTHMRDRTHLSVLAARTSPFFLDVDMRAEFRLWGGSTKRSMAALTGHGPALDAKPSGEVVLAGVTGPGATRWWEKGYGFHLLPRAAR